MSDSEILSPALKGWSSPEAPGCEAIGPASDELGVGPPSPPVILKSPKDSCQTSTSDDWPEPSPKDPCVPAWATGACGCEAWAYKAGCHRLSCRECAPDLRTRRMLAIRDRFEGPDGRRGKDVCYTVLTVPPELRAAAADPATWSKWRRAIWKAMRRKFGGRFAVERTDPAGDRAPDKWHPHLNLLWVQRDGARPFIDVDALRAAWKGIIGAEREPVIHHDYSGHPARLTHWYSYMGRTWPDWQGLVRRHLSVRWLGRYPKKRPRDPRCPECGLDCVFVTGLDEKGALELAALGPAAVRLEWEKREIARILQLADRQDRPRGRAGGEE